MKELIKITETENGKAVSARELHFFLEVKNHFTQWFNDNKSQFDEGIDYQSIKEKVNAGHTNTHRIDYALTLDAAKQISMLSRVAKGKQVRKYFIECEKKLQKVFSLPQSYSEALRELANEAEKRQEAEIKLVEAKNTIHTNKPKVVFADSVIGSSNSILVREFSKVISDENFTIGQNRLFKWFRDNGYLNTSNEPYQNFVDRGYFEVIERSIGSGTETFTSRTTKITGSGQIYFTKKLRPEIAA